MVGRHPQPPLVVFTTSRILISPPPSQPSNPPLPPAAAAPAQFLTRLGSPTHPPGHLCSDQPICFLKYSHHQRENSLPPIIRNHYLSPEDSTTTLASLSLSTQRSTATHKTRQKAESLHPHTHISTLSKPPPLKNNYIKMCPPEDKPVANGSEEMVAIDLASAVKTNGHLNGGEKDKKGFYNRPSDFLSNTSNWQVSRAASFWRTRSRVGREGRCQELLLVRAREPAHSGASRPTIRHWPLAKHLVNECELACEMCRGGMCRQPGSHLGLRSHRLLPTPHYLSLRITEHPSALSAWQSPRRARLCVRMSLCIFAALAWAREAQEMWSRDTRSPSPRTLGSIPGTGSLSVASRTPRPSHHLRCIGKRIWRSLLTLCRSLSRLFVRESSSQMPCEYSVP